MGDNEAQSSRPPREPGYLPGLHVRPAETDQTCNPHHPLLTRPLHAPLLLPNSSSEVRDLLASERTFLSNLRLALYLALVAGAIIAQFQFSSNDDPAASSPYPGKRVAVGLGAVFAVFSLIWMVMGVGNYARSVEGCARKRAIVQSGLKTQVVVGCLGVLVAGSCLFLIGVNARSVGSGGGEAQRPGMGMGAGAKAYVPW